MASDLQNVKETPYFLNCDNITMSGHEASECEARSRTCS